MEEKNKFASFDFSDTISVANLSKIREMKARNEKKPSTSIKTLQFEIDQEKDAALKATLIKLINQSGMCYKDLHQYCATLCNGDIDAGKNDAYNMITGMRKRPSMTVETAAIWADFIGYTVQFTKKTRLRFTEKMNEELDILEKDNLLTNETMGRIMTAISEIVEEESKKNSNKKSEE